MLPDFAYVLVALALVALALPPLFFAAGRRFVLRALPAVALFVFLLAGADVAYRIGRSHGGGGAVASDVEYTCSMHPQVRQKGPGLCPICHMELVPLNAAGAVEGPGITIDPVVVQNMGVRVHELRRGPLHRAVRAFAAVRAPESRLRDVALKFDGFVERLDADTEGMALRAGDPLFAVYSPDLVVAQEELIAARKSGDATLVDAARQKLLLWDVPPGEVDRLERLERAERTLVWRSPIDGILLRRDVVQGAPAMRNAVLLRIADLSVVWLDAQVPESQLAAVREGQTATATLAAAPGQEFEGTVVFVAPTLDETTRTGIVRVELANPDGAWKPGMFAHLVLHATLRDDALLVPSEAVIDTGLRRVAWVAVGKGRFEPRAVRVGASGDGGVLEVLDGLAAGERVVTSGQFLIDSESRLREGSQKLGEDGLMPGGDLPPRAAVALSADTQQRIDALLAAYLAVKTAMAEDRLEQGLWQDLRDAAIAVTAVPEAELQLPAGALADAMREVAEPDLVAARVAFKRVSGAAERLFEIARPGTEAGRTLYVQHCPMAEASWLSLESAIRNPYYGSSMLACGSVQRELALGVGGGR